MEISKKKLFKLLFFICFIILIFLLINAGRFLVVKDAPEKSDVIIIFSGDKGNRTIKGVDLYKEHYADKIIMSGGKVYE
ncbi:MAG: YdcF family protein, partial [Clostridiaceae bacterium]|nr:YdcF family protein [Clostridiaceae bacterium]